jgi:hypothetical protein
MDKFLWKGKSQKAKPKSAFHFQQRLSKRILRKQASTSLAGDVEGKV